MGKTAKYVMLTSLQQVLNKGEDLQIEQFGFEAGYLTVHQILFDVEHVGNVFNKQQSTDAIFLDVSTALEKV